MVTAEVEGAEIQTPAVVVQAPSGWTPRSGSWSVSRDESSGFAFMDRSYGTTDPAMEDAAVYVCVERAEESACPSGSGYVISVREVGRYRISISQERRKDAPRDSEVARVWSTATVAVR